VATIDPIPAARDLLSDEVSAQNLRLVDDIAALLRKNDASGTLLSNDTLMQSTLLCCEMLQNRLDVCLSALTEFLKSSTFTKSDVGSVELKELVAEFFSPRDPFVRDQLSEVITTIGAPDVIDRLYSKVERTRSHVLTRLGVEIDILCRRAKADKARFWQSPWFRRAMLVIEISCSITTVWFAYVWIHNPASYVSIPMIVTGFLVYGLGRFRRYLDANF
jgi:hypothetical protein